MAGVAGSVGGMWIATHQTHGSWTRIRKPPPNNGRTKVAYRNWTAGKWWVAARTETGLQASGGWLLARCDQQRDVERHDTTVHFLSFPFPHAVQCNTHPTIHAMFHTHKKKITAAAETDSCDRHALTPLAQAHIQTLTNGGHGTSTCVRVCVRRTLSRTGQRCPGRKAGCTCRSPAPQPPSSVAACGHRTA